LAAKIILFAIPFFFLLIVIELYFNYRRKAGAYRINDALTSLSLGLISRTKLLITFSLAATVYGWFTNYFSLTLMSADSLATWAFSFVLYDFLYYWYHRSSHQINFLWASHVVHHQSEEYNLTTALRQTSSSVFVWLFYIPSFILGIPAEVFFSVSALNLVYQFWVHTQLVGKLGWFEQVFVTPSHHRVHHAQNEYYIDKNHGGVFIIWDKLFGTFKQELDSEQVIYGVRRPVKSFNPIWVNFHTWFSLLNDAVRTSSWFDKLRIWFMPTGWRPQDMMEKFPIIKQPAGKQVKYDPLSSTYSKYYSVFQYSISVFFTLMFLQHSAQLSFPIQVMFWILITWPLLNAGLLLEGRQFALKIEFTRLFVSLLLVAIFRSQLANWLLVITLIYCFISLIGSLAIGSNLKRQLI